MAFLPYRTLTVAYIMIMVDLSPNMLGIKGLGEIKEQLFKAGRALFHRKLNVNITIFGFDHELIKYCTNLTMIVDFDNCIKDKFGKKLPKTGIKNLNLFFIKIIYLTEKFRNSSE